MNRDRQIELMKTAEERTIGYLRNWLKNPAVKAALHRQNRDSHAPGDDDHKPARRQAC